MKFISKLTLAALLTGSMLSTAAYAYEKNSTFTGFYLGGQVGYGMSEMDVSRALNGDIHMNGLLGGAYTGFGYLMDQLYMGVEADFEYSDLDGRQGIVNAKKDHSYGAAVRLGYEVVDNTLFYIKAGGQRGRFTGSTTTGARKKENVNGFEVGGGIEVAVHENATMRLDYSHVMYESFATNLGATTFRFDPTDDRVRLGFAFNF